MAGIERNRRNWSQTLWLFLAPVLARLTLAALIAAGAMLVFLKIADSVFEGGATRHFDAAVLHFFRTHQTPLLHELMTIVSRLAGPIPQMVLVMIASIGFALARRFKPDGLTMLVSGFGGLALIMGLKALFRRPRPEETFAHLWYSFPSGHSFLAVTVYGMLAYHLARNASLPRRRRLWVAAIMAILLVGFSRVFLGEHYPSDVLAGFAVALPWLWGCLALPAAFQRHGQSGLSPEESRARFEEGRARLKEAALFLPNLVKLATRLARDPRVPRSRKIALLLLAGYLAMPFDLIPDFIPVLGVADDIILVSVTLAWVMKVVPEQIVREHWDGATDLFALLDKARSGIRDLLNRD